MMIKINAKESVEIIEDVFVNVINEEGTEYYSWDEMSDTQIETFSGLAKEVKEVYEKYRAVMSA